MLVARMGLRQGDFARCWSAHLEMSRRDLKEFINGHGVAGPGNGLR